jgi:hypothetical protein
MNEDMREKKTLLKSRKVFSKLRERSSMQREETRFDQDAFNANIKDLSRQLNKEESMRRQTNKAIFAIHKWTLIF